MEDKLHPGTELSIARTVLANASSLLAYVRTALGCLLGGVGLFKFFGHPLYEVVGIVLVTPTLQKPERFGAKAPRVKP